MPTSRIRKALVVLALFIAAIVSLVGPTHALSRLQGGWTQVTATFRWAATETARSKSEETGAETSNGASREVPPAGAQSRVEPSGEAPAAANAGTTNGSGNNGPLAQGEAADTDATTSATSPLALGGVGQPTGAANGTRRVPDVMARLSADGQGAGAAGGFGRRAPSDGEPSGSGSVSGEPGTSSRTGDRLDGVGPVAGVDSPRPAELAPVLPPAETPPTDETPGDRNRNDRGEDGPPPDPLPTLVLPPSPPLLPPSLDPSLPLPRDIYPPPEFPIDGSDDDAGADRDDDDTAAIPAPAPGVLLLVAAGVAALKATRRRMRSVR